jgi:uncharacterized protein YndB with AHSA1/START domain
MVMSGPDGETSPIEGVILEVVPNTRIVFTNLQRGLDSADAVHGRLLRVRA